jgi:hypothetical protein
LAEPLGSVRKAAWQPWVEFKELVERQQRAASGWGQKGASRRREAFKEPAVSVLHKASALDPADRLPRLVPFAVPQGARRRVESLMAPKASGQDLPE